MENPAGVTLGVSTGGTCPGLELFLSSVWWKVAGVVAFPGVFILAEHVPGHIHVSVRAGEW